MTPRDMVYLVGLDGALRGTRFPIQAPISVGRGPYNHVVLDDMRVSRQHSKVTPEDDGFVVYDLNSVNGTFVNDVEVRRRMLEPNDVVRFGPYAFRFEAEADPHRTVRVTPLDEQIEALVPRTDQPAVRIIDSLDARRSASHPQIDAALVDLEDSYRKLQTLYAFTRAVAASLDPTEVLEHIAHNLLEIFPPSQSVEVYLRDGASDTMVRRIELPATSGAQPTLLSAVIYDEVVRKGRAILSAPPSGGLSIHAPMQWGDLTQGVLHVRRSGGDGLFTQGDLDLLSGMAAQGAMALQNARMHQSSLRQQRLQRDLQLAEQIQKSFLPRQLPRVAGVEFITEYRPAYSVGGDFYDVFWVQEGRTIGIFIGDVSGKGVSAALLMARITSDLRVAALAESDPAGVLSRVNEAMLARRQDDMFVTVLFLTLDVRSGEIVMASAGHLPPFVRRFEGGHLERIEGGAGTAIGIFDDPGYHSLRLRIQPGDSLVLCTDGVIEATSAHGGQFGFERLEASLRSGNTAPSQLATRLLEDVRNHVGEAAQADDLTLIVCGAVDPLSEWARKPDDTMTMPGVARGTTPTKGVSREPLTDPTTLSDFERPPPPTIVEPRREKS